MSHQLLESQKFNMDKFLSTQVKINDISSQIEELKSLKQKIESGYITLLENHIIGSVQIPYLEDAKFIGDWYKYHQTKDIVPFYVKQNVNVVVGGDIYSLLINNHFGIEKFDIHSLTGEIVFLDRADYHIRKLDKDDPNTNKEIDLSICSIGAKVKSSQGTFLQLALRKECGENNTEELTNELIYKTIEFIESGFNKTKNETLKTNFSISNENLDFIKEGIKKNTSLAIKSVLSPDFKNQKILWNDELTKDITRQFTKALENNNIKASFRESARNPQTPIKKAKI